MPIVLQVALVADKQLHNILIAELVDLGQPVLDILEGLTVCDIIDEDDSVGTLVVWGGDGLKSLLSCSIPDLKLDSAAVEIERANLEVNTDGW